MRRLTAALTLLCFILTTQGADLLAQGKITLTAPVIDLQAITDRSSNQSQAQSKSFTIGARPAGLIGTAVNSIVDNTHYGVAH